MKIEILPAFPAMETGELQVGAVVEMDKARAVAFVNAGYAAWVPEPEEEGAQAEAVPMRGRKSKVEVLPEPEVLPE